jgi:hypothetical protein
MAFYFFRLLPVKQQRQHPSFEVIKKNSEYGTILLTVGISEKNSEPMMHQSCATE